MALDCMVLRGHPTFTIAFYSSCFLRYVFILHQRLHWNSHLLNAIKRVSPEVVIVDCEIDSEKMFNLTGPVDFDR